MFSELIAKVADSLKKHKIPYMLIGGQAVLLYGSPRLTRDIDIALGISIDKLQEIIDVAKEIGLKVIPADYKDFVQKTFVLPVKDMVSSIRVDFIFSFTPSYEKQAISRTKEVEIKGVSVKFASLEDVIIHKIFSSRPRDLDDVKSIIIKNPDYNFQYIKKWLGEFDKPIEFKGLLKSFEQLIKDL